MPKYTVCISFEDMIIEGIEAKNEEDAFVKAVSQINEYPLDVDGYDARIEDD
jgi:hypothetical protein